MARKTPDRKKPFAYFLDSNQPWASKNSDERGRTRELTALGFRRITTPAQMRGAAREPGQLPIWVALDGSIVANFIKIVRPRPRQFGSLLVLNSFSDPTWQAAQYYFRRVAAANAPGSFLANAELAEVLASPDRADLFIGGTVDRVSERVILFRGDFSKLVVPIDAFPAGPRKLKPDVSRFCVIDSGEQIKFGAYEISASEVLRRFHPTSRARLNAKKKADESGFGASLRRLRKKRKMTQEDFSPLSAKTIARIERGDVKRPRGKTRTMLARKLGVRAAEIESY